MRITISGQHDHPELTSGQTFLVTALGPGERDDTSPHASGHRPTLDLYLHDLDFPIQGFIHPERFHVQALIDHVRAAQPEHLHAACYAGISRSSALAAVALAAVSDLSDDDVIAEVRRVRPGAYPNALILKHADALLERDLSGACERLLGHDDWTPSPEDYED